MQQHFLWIPTLTFLGERQSSPELLHAFGKQGIHEQEISHPIQIYVQSSLRNQEFLLNIDASLGFSFTKLWFKESKGIPDSYTDENALCWHHVHLQNAERYDPEELAEYFKKYWTILSDKHANQVSI